MRRITRPACPVARAALGGAHAPSARSERGCQSTRRLGTCLLTAGMRRLPENRLPEQGRGVNEGDARPPKSVLWLSRPFHPLPSPPIRPPLPPPTTPRPPSCPLTPHRRTSHI